MPTSLIVVDDFLGAPNEFRAAALRLTYPELAGAAYPGRNSLERINIAGLEREISSIVREPLALPDPLKSHAKCRIALASDSEERAQIHIDPGYWSGILFLSRPEDCSGGTDFFRHIPTRTDRVPDTPGGLAAMGYSSYEALQRQIIDKDSLDRSKWELTMTVPMRFNRLILLRPWLWHTAGPGFGDSLENGRLVYLMFFNLAR
jgi:hypothetical protein